MSLTKQDMTELFTKLVRTRLLDQAVIRWMSEGKLIGFYHPAAGGEGPGVGAAHVLKKDDYIYPHLRGHGLPHLIGKDAPVRYFLAGHCGKRTEGSSGWGVFHWDCPEYGFHGAGGTIGSGFPVTVGFGLAAQKNGRGQVAVCFFGDGTVNRGTFHEAALTAANWKLPIIWVCENNGVAQFVSFAKSFPTSNVADLAGGYGMPGVVVDGQDVVAVAEAMTEAVNQARAGKGPSLIECKTIRLGCHSVGTPDVVHGQPRDQEELSDMRQRDVIELIKGKLLDRKILTDERIKEIYQTAQEEVLDIEKFIKDSPMPDSYAELSETLYCRANGEEVRHA